MKRESLMFHLYKSSTLELSSKGKINELFVGGWVARKWIDMQRKFKLHLKVERRH